MRRPNHRAFPRWSPTDAASDRDAPLPTCQPGDIATTGPVRTAFNSGAYGRRRMHITTRQFRLLAASTLAVAGVVALSAQPVDAGGHTPNSSVRVTSGADSGPGSFRAAIDAANLDPAIDTVRFHSGLHVDLLDEVVFTGEQDLTISGRNSTISGASVAPDTDTWDSGLFVATGGGD